MMRETRRLAEISLARLSWICSHQTVADLGIETGHCGIKTSFCPKKRAKLFSGTSTTKKPFFTNLFPIVSMFILFNLYSF